MNNQIEIPIWFNGNIKWISNLSSHSTCQDVIKAILSSSLSNNIYDIYQIYECWRGIERPLKNHYRIVKLWKSWKDESKNVILTIRLINNNNTKKTNKISSFILIKEQENKLNSLKHKINKTNKKINEYNYLNNNDLLYYINLSNSIINLNKEIKKKKKIISYLISLIEKENKQDLFEYDFNYILFNINKTLMSSRKLTELSDDIDIKINNIIQDIDYKQILLDKLELDYHLQERNFIEKIDNQYQSKNKFIMKQIFLSPTSFINTKTLTGYFCFYFFFLIFVCFSK